MPRRTTPLDVRIARKIQAPPWTIQDDVWSPFTRAPMVVEGVTREEVDRVHLLFDFSPVECWLWIGALSQKHEGPRRGQDRPVIQLAGRGSPVMHVLRVMLCLRDSVPLDQRTDLQACHGPCDNALCVNPFHGYWGTNQQNHDDRKTRRPDSFLVRSRRNRKEART